MKKITTKKIVTTAVIAAVYAAITLLLYPISFSAVQIRVSEALTLLPLLMPEAIAGLTIGCFIANCFSSPIDMVFGTLASLIAALLTFVIGKTVKREPLKLVLGAIPPVIVNGLIVPLTFLAATDTFATYLYGVLSVSIGQAVAVYAVGIPLYYIIKRVLSSRAKGQTDKSNT